MTKCRKGYSVHNVQSYLGLQNIIYINIYLYTCACIYTYVLVSFDVRTLKRRHPQKTMAIRPSIDILYNK